MGLFICVVVSCSVGGSFDFFICGWVSVVFVV